MSQYYTRTFAFANYEVKIHFCCAKCGKEVDLIRYLTYSDMGHAGGFNNSEAGKEARLKLAVHVSDDFRKDIDAMKRNRAKLQTTKDAMYDTIAPLRCPDCGVVNIPDAGCERKTLVPAWITSLTRMQSAILFVSPMILWCVLLVVFAIITDTVGQAFLYSLAACIALIMLAIWINRLLSKKA